MQKAYLVINKSEKKLVDANDVEHSDYSKIFQCPRCNETLTLRKGYLRSGHWVNATFVHPEGDPRDCALRNSLDFSVSKQPVFDLIERGQSSKKLERAFIDCFQYYIFGRMRPIIGKYSPIWAGNQELHLKRKIKYNSEPGRVHSDPALFVRALSSILKSNQSQKYIESELLILEDWLRTNQEAIDFFRGKDETTISVDTRIKQHCRQLVGIAKYIRQGASEAFRQDFISIVVWGGQDLPVPFKYIGTVKEQRDGDQILRLLGKDRVDNEMEIEQKRKPQIELIRSFSVQHLKQVCEDPEFLRDSFLEIYQADNLSDSNLIKFVLSKTLDSIKFYDWSALPSFYS
jgi:uncharacterized C2H2 Zn-finger protein